MHLYGKLIYNFTINNNSSSNSHSRSVLCDFYHLAMLRHSSLCETKFVLQIVTLRQINSINS